MVTKSLRRRGVLLAACCSIVAAALSSSGAAQPDGPSLVDSNLGVRTAVDGLVTPTSMAFIGPNDLLVLEKATGKVQRVVNGVIQGTVLDLPVQFGLRARLAQHRVAPAVSG